MKKYTKDSGDLLKMVEQWQTMENHIADYAKKELPMAKNPLTKVMLQVLRLEAEKRCFIQQMILDNLGNEAVNLSPEELAALSGHLNKYIEAEEKVLSGIEGKAENSELPLSRYLFTYLITDIKKQNALLRQFDDELKAASIPTSATAKKFSVSATV